MANKFLRDLTQCSAIAIATGLVLSGGKAHAQSFAATGTVAEGAATITTGVGTTDITVQTSSAVIDWAPDDINGFGDILFQQAGTTATFTNGAEITNFAVLNRILPTDITRRIVFDGNVVSRIQDAMGSRTGGTVFFYTPGGIVIGANATFDVGNLGLTTSAPLTDGNGNFIVNNQVRFQQSQSSGSISIDPGARINALAEGSYVALFAPRITQGGEINVNGQAALVGAEAGTITFSPDGLFDIEVEIGSDAGVPIEHYGSTGGPASSGPGDNHRIYLVSVAKNNAATLAIRGGSKLGFDIAQSASFDGEAVVLSAGYSITVGDIGPDAPGVGNNSITIEDADYGFGPGLEFTSDVFAAASQDINLNVGHDTLFHGNAKLEGGYVTAQMFDQGTGMPGLGLQVGGDLSLIANRPRFGNDSGQATLNVSNGSTAFVGGNLLIASNAQADFDANGEVVSGYAGLYVGDLGSSLTVGGNLHVNSDVDLSGVPGGQAARAGSVDLSVVNNGVLDIGGETRLSANARAANVVGGRGASGGDAFAGFAYVNVQQGGQFVTGELAMAINAHGGDSDSGNGGNAQGGSSQINVSGAGSVFEVLRGNTVGDPASGDLRFLSSEVVGGSSLVGNGGNANGGSLNIYISDAARLTLPDEVGNPLRIVSSAIGGDTSADNAFAGSASGGQEYFYAFNATADFGRLALLSTLQGGSVLGGAIGSTGGNASSGFSSFQLQDSDVTVALDPFVFNMIGGAGSADGSGAHGTTSASDFNISVNRGSLTIGGMTVSSFGVNGDGGAGESRSFYMSVRGADALVNGDIAIDAGYASIDVSSDFETGIAGSLTVMGNALLQSSGPRFGSDNGGTYVSVGQGSRFDVAGDLSLISRAHSDANGDLIASSSGATVYVQDAGSVLAVGGNLLLDAGIDLRGDLSGVSAQGGFAQVSVVSGGLVDVTGLTRIVADAMAGSGADAFGGSSNVYVQQGGQFVTGELAMASHAFGGDSDIGNGGNAQAGSAQIYVEGMGSAFEVLRGNTIADASGDLYFLSNKAVGGSSLIGSGGNATGGSNSINVSNGAQFVLPNEVGNALTIVSSAVGGDTFADNAVAGSAFAGREFLYAFNTAADLGRLAFLSTAQGGSVLGGAIGSTGGNATGGYGQFQFSDSDVTAAFDPFVSRTIGGTGSADGSGVHGAAFASDFNAFFSRGTLSIVDGLTVSFSAINGDGSVGEGRGFYMSTNGTDVTVNGDIAIDAGYAGLQISSDFETGLAGSLTVTGNLSVQSSGPRHGNDNSGANINVYQGSRLDVGGDVSLIARAFSDANGDLIARSSNATIGAHGAGSVVAISGNLLLDAGIDLRGDQSGVAAQGGFAQAYASNEGLLDVAGLTRIVTDAYGGGGAEARAGFALASAYGGGQFRTGELSISADAYGGQDIGFGGGAAIAGQASLEAYDPGSSLVVSSPTTGERAFLSSQAFGGTGLNGDGGAATAGYVGINLHGGATISLPNDPLNPLLLRSIAQGGDTAANDASGGSAQAGSIAVNIHGSTANLGHLRLEATGTGGSALPLAERSRGGDASNGHVYFYAFQSAVEVAFDEIALKLQGGDGSSDGFGDGGNAFGGWMDISAVRSTLDILGDLNVSGLAIGGAGLNGGYARGVSGSLYFEDSPVSVAGHLDFLSQAQGGLATSADFGTGGTAEAGYLGMTVQDSVLDIAGNATIGTSGQGGHALTGQGGTVQGSEAVISLRDGAVINAGGVNVFTTGTGGSILPGGIGNGGSANVGRASIRLEPTFDNQTGETRPASHAAINSDVSLTSVATGGNAGDLGGDGGQATSGTASLTARTAGTLTLGASLTMESRSEGGRAPAGTGGIAYNNGAEISNQGFVDSNTGDFFDGGDIAIAGDATLAAASIGGAGQIGGEAYGGFFRVRSQMSETAIGGTLNLLGSVTGGEGLSGGAGGNAFGGSFLVDAFGFEGDPEAAQITLGNLAAQFVVQGGKGGDALMGDGGRGGDAQGYNGSVLGRASKGTLTVTGSTTVDFNTLGGEGGTGANGGAGGNSSGGSLNFGTASGGAILGAVDGSANFTDVAIAVTNIGGQGGEATNGTGGAGGTGQGGFATILARGAPINANTVSVVTHGVGGNGGAGATAGNGGDGIGGTPAFVVSQAFQNPGRGTTNIGSLQMLSQGIGGAGANPGQGLYGAGGSFQVTQADVQVGSVDIQVIGDGVPSSPFVISLSNATLAANTIVGNLAGNVQLQVVDSTLTTDIFDLQAAGFVLPALDPNAPPPVQGVIDATQQLRLVSREGDVATRAQLQSAEIAVTSAGSVSLGNLSAPLLTIAGGTGSIELASIGGGAVALQTSGTIALGSISAQSLSATSTGGDIVATQPILLSGALALDAAGAINLADVSAAQMTARTHGGGIALAGAVNVANGLVLDSALGITAGPVMAASLSATARAGDIAFNSPVNVSGLMDLNASGLIRFAQTIAGSIIAVSGQGDIIAEDALEVDGALTLDAGGSIALGGVSAASLGVTSRGGDIALSAPVEIAGAIALNSAANIVTAGMTAQSIDLAALAGGIDTGVLTATNTVSIATRDSISLSGISAQSLIASSTGGDIVATQPISLSGALALDAAGAVALANVNAAELSVHTHGGGIALAGAVNVANGLVLDSALGITAGPVTAASLSATARSGAIALNSPVNVSGAITLDSTGAIGLGDVSAQSLAAFARGGDIVARGTIAATGHIGAQASGAVELAKVSGTSLTIRAGGATRIAGEWQSGAIDITTAQLEITAQGLVKGGGEGVFSLHSLNEGGVLFTQTNPGDFAGLVIDGEMFGKLQTGTINIGSPLSGAASAITIGDFDLAANTAFKTLNFANGSAGTIHVSGNVKAGQARDPITLGLTTGRFTLDSAKGSIDLLANKGEITITANKILVGEGSVINALTGEETEKQLADLFNKAATTKREKGVLGASKLSLLAGSQLLVQNTGTADARAGITVGTANGLKLGNGETTLFFVVNGKLTDAAGVVLAGRDAAKAYLSKLKGTEALAAKSLFNGCELSGCAAVVNKSGEVTATVSAAVSGATNTGSGTGTTGSGSGSKGGSNDDSGGEESGGSSTGGAGATGTGGSSSGGEVTADNVDDGGGGDEEFAIEEDSGDDGASESEDSDSSEEESSEEEQGSEEEDEDSDGPVSGPIMRPPNLINTNSLQTRGIINDPISGSGNPALIDPDVDAPPSVPSGAQ